MARVSGPSKLDDVEYCSDAHVDSWPPGRAACADEPGRTMVVFVLMAVETTSPHRSWTPPPTYKNNSQQTAAILGIRVNDCTQY